ncbi:TonB-dependent receptor [Pedobacter sp. SD-b]|uniref:TonB-dependent receptor n=1 Tax=Pedobacter segetis TaxID=2793069 RepID=A0ABS1BLP9_9SPHI|nr:TonB-dependent receptor [Pedobacter segetis]MBK0383819.1 TonB-dependent receptor [Pedobacter segetis]
MKRKITIAFLMFSFFCIPLLKAQGKKINGKVTDSNGLTLPGVSIGIKGSPGGTQTDVNGNYTINVSNSQSVLVFSYLGYITQEISIGNNSIINVSLVQDNKSLQEVVVIGYGTQQKASVSSAISSVSAKEISSRPVADAAQALQGKVAGVTIVQNSGAPGGTGGTAIRIRGISSVTGTNNPLIVLDGFPLPDQGADNILNSFSPNEIESIDILKDAAAASIYGVRGSNGVVLITTKRGKAGITVINADVYRGYQQAWRLPSLLNAKEYAIINNEARIASLLNPIPKLADPNAVEQTYGNGTDWLGQVFRGAAMTNAALNISGGSDKAQYALSTGYFNQDGIIENTNFERFNLRFNGDLKASDKLKIGNSLTMSRTKEIPQNTYDPFNSVIILALTAPPTVQPRNPDGTYAGGNGGIDGFDEPNPVYNLEVPQFVNTKYRLTGTVFGEYQLFAGLKLKANLGLDFVTQSLRGYNPAIPSTGARPIVRTGVTDQTNFNPNYLGEFTANYTKKINDHNFSLLAGFTAQENNYNSLGGGRSGYTVLGFPVLNDNIYAPKDISETYNFNGYGTSTLLSYVARASYDYKSKYIFQASVRRDGSSNFGPDNKYADFSAFSFAWRAIDEDFIKPYTWLSDLKLRLSYGSVGNQDIPAFSYLAGINSGIGYAFGDNSGNGGLVTGAAPTALSNPNLGWEKNQQINVGLDLGFLKNRITAVIDLYSRKSLDLLFRVPVPATSGTYEPIPFNTGDMINKGIDFSLNTVNFEKPNFKWTSNLVLSAYKNELTSLGLASPINNGFARISGGARRVEQGYPVNYFYGFKTEGIFQNQAEIAAHATQTAGSNPATSTAPGDIKFVDINGDGVINDQDRTNLGNSIPNFTYGFTNNFTYKNFDLSVFLQGSQGNKVLNFNRWYTESGVSNGNYSKYFLGRWTGEGTSNSIPRAIQNDPNQNNRVSDRFVEDASYIRLKNVRLSYSLPAKWMKSAKIQKIQIYGSAQNLATITNYTGFDPEVGGGVDIGYYPQARTFLLGINANF